MNKENRTRKVWTEDEINFLRENYIKLGKEACAEHLKRDVTAIVNRSAKLHLNPKNLFTQEEDDFLKENYYKLGQETCAKVLGRTRAALNGRAGFLKIRKSPNYWTEEEDRFLRDNYPTRGAAFCAKTLNRKHNAIVGRCGKIGVNNEIYFWKKDEILFLKENYPKLGGPFCAKYLNKNRATVVAKATKIGLEKERRVVDGESFIKMDTPESVYLAGFIFGDGNIQKKHARIRVEVVTEDMEKIIHLFSKFGEWHRYDRQRNHWKPVTVLTTYNRQIYDFLCEMDYINKSHMEPTKILEKIPEHLKHYWWRGLSDSDFCFSNSSRNTLTGAGTFDYKWEEAIKLFNSLNIEKFYLRRTIGKRGKGSTLKLNRYDEIRKFGEYIYKNYENDKIGFPRKFEKFKEIMVTSKGFQNILLTKEISGKTFSFSCINDACIFLESTFMTIRDKCTNKLNFKGYRCEFTSEKKSKIYNKEFLSENPE